MARVNRRAFTSFTFTRTFPTLISKYIRYQKVFSFFNTLKLYYSVITLILILCFPQYFFVNLIVLLNNKRLYYFYTFTIVFICLAWLLRVSIFIKRVTYVLLKNIRMLLYCCIAVLLYCPSVYKIEEILFNYRSTSDYDFN